MKLIDLFRIEVEKFYGLNPGETKVKTRRLEIREPRQIIQYLCKKDNLGSLGYIAKNTSSWNTDHTTVLHSFKTITKLRNLESKLDDDITQIENIISKKRSDNRSRKYYLKSDGFIILETSNLHDILKRIHYILTEGKKDNYTIEIETRKNCKRIFELNKIK